MDPVRSFLQNLEETQGDARAQAAVAAEFMVRTRPKHEREMIHVAVDAAALLHWFGAEHLRKVLDISDEDSQFRFSTLKGFPFIEPYRRGQSQFCNVHESARLGWRRKIAHGDPERFRALSVRASACFANDATPAGRIEWIYHLLCGDPNAGAFELEKLHRKWSDSGQLEARYSLAIALGELVDTCLVDERARAWSLLTIGWVRDDRGEGVQLLEIAEVVLSLARASGDKSAEVGARNLAGLAWKARGKLAAALAAFEEGLAISRQLAEQDLSNADWQQSLGESLNGLGDVLLEQGNLAAARAAFDEEFGIRRRLVDQDPSSAGWQRDMGASLNRVGDVLQAQGKLEEAQAAFEESLAIRRRLADRDPSNAGWQAGLGVALNRVGCVLEAQGKLEAARRLFEEDMAIRRRLVDQDPNNASWQRVLGVSLNRVGSVLQAQGKLEAARAAFEEDMAISQRLAEQDPANVGWQTDLAASLNRLGDVLRVQGELEAARTAFEESLAISRSLADQHPKNAGWQQSLGGRSTVWAAFCKHRASWRLRGRRSKKDWRSVGGWQSKTQAIPAGRMA
jgi:tetratricopeptide (TPR) repeat protein